MAPDSEGEDLQPDEWQGLRSGTQVVSYGLSYLGCGPLPVAVTTRIIAFLIGNPYNPSFTTVTVGGAISESYLAKQPFLWKDWND